MTKKQKKMLYRILIAAVLFLAAKFIPMPTLVSTVLYFAAYVTIGYDILRKEGHLQPSGVRRKLPDGGRHDRRHRARHL